jgi:hypothetical protein
VEIARLLEFLQLPLSIEYVFRNMNQETLACLEDVDSLVGKSRDIGWVILQYV